MQWLSLLPILVSSSILPTGDSLKISGIQVPTSEVVGENAVLRCEYDLESSILYAIKWYKDDTEFYRFLPKHYPKNMVFGIDGLTVDKDASNEIEVKLLNLTTASSGTYRCEVISDAPLFETVFAEATMSVVGPTITGENPGVPKACTAADFPGVKNELEIKILEEKLKQIHAQEGRSAKEHELQMAILELQKSYWAKKSLTTTN